ncbi:(4Fe-4S)-binding protein [Flavihumibacter sp. CACIAM 22H1]|uniref:(4Fe-4S)-binding protein n=1 Tax=Flavihumibacter sp. CACIAM 22H1 TaxID=1812911 RepID=UPI0007A91BB7|nr:(4Fe-4S)-binding protein [Flavihumibacter sp. CACIAM 22H1]KYP13348.1 MAG: hypothetical protein A1D16_19490 [Flavihumibacter sp. CACIAM 22H1]
MNYKLEKPVEAAIGTQQFTMEVVWRNGQFVADEPVSTGGKDLGPDPFTLLLSSLATCTLATLRMYIDRKGWEIPEIRIKANLFQYKKDDKTITTIDRDLRFDPAITDEQMEKLVEIAGNCPISKLLKGEVTERTFIFNEDDTVKKMYYRNDTTTVVWKPSICKHSGRCVTGLPRVFNLQARPWINMQGASDDQIRKQVDACPTGALTWAHNNSTAS